MTRSDFVTGVDDRNVMTTAGLEYSFQVGTVYCEDVPYSRLLQRPDEELAACDHSHASPYQMVSECTPGATEAIAMLRT
jgi:hypothetical protein